MIDQNLSGEVSGLFESAQHFLDVENYRAATERLEQVIVLCPDCSHYWERLGTCYREDKQVERAELCYVRARMLDSNNFHAAFHWGVLKMDAERWEEAEQQFGDAVRLNPSDAVTRANLANCLLKLNKKAEGRAEMLKALKLDPSIPIPQYWLPFLRGR
jgi:tetratricopeptide (TPR) repeat protein